MSNSFISKEEIAQVAESFEKNKDKSLFIDEEKNQQNQRLKTDGNEEDANPNKDDQIIGEVSYRWIIFTCFFVLSFSNGLQWVTISAISDNFQKAYEQGTVFTDLFSLSYLIVFPFVFPVAAYIIDNRSVKYGLMFAAILNICGAILKCFINENIYLALTGQFLSAIGQPFILSSSGKISSIWFRADIRATITSCLAISNILGTLIGIIFNTFFVPSEISIVEDYKSSVLKYIIAEAILVGLFSIPTIVLFKSKPRQAPSVSQNNIRSPPFKEALKILFSNRNFVCLFVISAIIVGYFNLMGTILNKFLSKFGIDNNQTNILGGVGNILGLVASIVVSVIADKKKEYKSLFIILSVSGLVSQIFLTVFSEIFSDEYNFYIWLICWTVLMMTCVPFYAIGMDYVCEITYPVGELVSGGLILTGSQILGIGETFLADYFLYELNMRYLVNIMTSALLACALGILFIMKEDLLRNKHEHDKPLLNNSEELETEDEKANN